MKSIKLFYSSIDKDVFIKKISFFFFRMNYVIFDRLKEITNNLQSIIFRSVTHLELHDELLFKHEFFHSSSSNFSIT